MTFNIAEIKKKIAEHDQTVDVQNCPHCCSKGDNYGESCRHCGKQLKGYGNGGWFGMNITGAEKCLHDFAPLPAEDGEPMLEFCRFCERVQEVEEISESVN